jgi:hypothetical protein
VPVIIKKLTMKLTRKTEKLILTKKGSINAHYISAAQSVHIVGCKLYCKKWTGHRTLKDVSPRIKEMLKSQGYKFTTGNDAPKGGVEGDFILISSTAINFLMGIKKLKLWTIY